MIVLFFFFFISIRHTALSTRLNRRTTTGGVNLVGRDENDPEPSIRIGRIGYTVIWLFFFLLYINVL